MLLLERRRPNKYLKPPTAPTIFTLPILFKSFGYNLTDFFVCVSNVIALFTSWHYNIVYKSRLTVHVCALNYIISYVAYPTFNVTIFFLMFQMHSIVTSNSHYKFSEQRTKMLYETGD